MIHGKHSGAASGGLFNTGHFEIQVMRNIRYGCSSGKTEGIILTPHLSQQRCSLLHKDRTQELLMGCPPVHRDSVERHCASAFAQIPYG
jgi:hypothetical protein